MAEIQNGGNSKMADIVQDCTRKGFAPLVFGCPPYTHNTKKACYVILRGCPYAPIHLDAPMCLDALLYVWMPPVCWDAPCMFECPHIPPCMFGHPHIFGCPCMLWCSYAWMPPACLDTPICLDPPICLDDVWMSSVHTQHKESMLRQTKGVSIYSHTFGCPLYIHSTKKACFVRLRGCLYVPIHLDTPFVWMPTCIFGTPMFALPPYI